MESNVPDIPDALLFEEVPCFISIQDKDCKIQRVNKKFKEVFGNRLGDYCYEVYKHRDNKCPVCLVDRVYADKKSHDSEEVVFSPEGYPLHVIVNVAPIFDETGNITAVMEMATDITETNRLQRKLEESSEKYRTLYDTVPCYISVQDKNFKLIDANTQFKKEFGGIIGDYCYKAYKKRDERCEVCPVAQVFEDGEIHTSEEIVASKKGDLINMLVFAAPLKDIEGNVKSVMEMSTNITSIKKMQSQMTNLGQMVSGLAHTIKGIITGLEGGMYVVNSGLKNHQEELVHKGWDMVQRNVDRISHLVLDMLYFAKAREPELNEVKLDSFCNEIFDLFSKKFNENNITGSLDIEEIKPLYGDSKALYTLILTLVENAIQACIWDKVKSEHHVNLSLKEDGGFIILSISDNGIGMAEEVKSKLFTEMYSSKGSGGSGFGLLVVKKIVDEHNGEINVESFENQGAKFIVKFKRR